MNCANGFSHLYLGVGSCFRGLRQTNLSELCIFSPLDVSTDFSKSTVFHRRISHLGENVFHLQLRELFSSHRHIDFDRTKKKKNTHTHTHTKISVEYFFRNYVAHKFYRNSMIYTWGRSPGSNFIEPGDGGSAKIFNVIFTY